MLAHCFYANRTNHIKSFAACMLAHSFYANRINRLVVEAGLGHLPFKEKVVITPTGVLLVWLVCCLCG